MHAAQIASFALTILALAACGASPAPPAAPVAAGPTGPYALLGTKTQGDFHLAHGRVSLAIDGVAVAGLRHVAGAETGLAQAASAADRAKIVMDRDTGRSKLTVDSGSEADKVMRAWRRAVLDGKVDRKSVSLIFHNDAGEEDARVTLFEAWPSKWEGPELNARNSAHATEAIEIAWERFEMK